MDTELEEFWRTYFCRASSGWANEITPEMYQSVLGLMGIGLPTEAVVIGKKIFYHAALHDVDSVAKHIDDPKACTANPYVTQAMIDIKKNDVKWTDTIIRKRTPNYPEVYHRIVEAAEEIEQTPTCYSPHEIVDLVKDIVSPSDKRI